MKRTNKWYLNVLMIAVIMCMTAITGYAQSGTSLNNATNDLDDDKIHDVWELTWLTTITACVASNDSDGDGLTNLQEYEAAVKAGEFVITDSTNMAGYKWNNTTLTPNLNVLTKTEDVRLYNPKLKDSDFDGIDDDWEMIWAGNLATLGGANADADGDGWTDHAEYSKAVNAVLNKENWVQDNQLFIKYNPLYQDSDFDLLEDKWELLYFGNLTQNGLLRSETDYDKDGLNDKIEQDSNYNPVMVDTDNDGIDDAEDYLNADTDEDGLADWWEMTYFGDLTTSEGGSDDYDSDGWTDLREYQLRDMKYPLEGGFDPTNSDNAADPGAGTKEERKYYAFVLKEGKWVYTHVLEQKVEAAGTVNFYELDDNGVSKGNVINDSMQRDSEGVILASELKDDEIDSDGDYISDGEETKNGTKETLRDSDEDGIDDNIELWTTYTDPNDGLDPWFNRVLDLTKSTTKRDYVSVDTDGDGINDDYKIQTSDTVADRKAYAVVRSKDAEDGYTGLDGKLGAYTIEFWFKLNSDSELTGTLVEKTSYMADGGAPVNFPQDFRVRLENGYITFYYNLTGKAEMLKEKYEHRALNAEDCERWMHLAIVVYQDNTANRYHINMYLHNGIEEEPAHESGAMTGTLRTTNSAGDLVFGERNKDATERLSFYLDEFRVWGKARTATEIQSTRHLITHGEVDLGAKPVTSISFDAKQVLKDNSVSLDHDDTNDKDDAILTFADPHAYLFADSDRDGIEDWWEITYFNNLEQVADDDPDEDGLSNYYEFLLRAEVYPLDDNNSTGNLGAEPTDAKSLDAVGDGYVDSDGDGLLNIDEMNNSCDPNNPDTDDDGISDRIELEIGASPTHPMSVVYGDEGKTLLADIKWDDFEDEDYSKYVAKRAPHRYLKLVNFDEGSNEGSNEGSVGDDNDGYIELPVPNRFATGNHVAKYNRVMSGDFTLEMWVRTKNADVDGWIFENRSADTGFGWRLGFEKGHPKGEIFKFTDDVDEVDVVIYVGGESATGGESGVSTPKMEADTWTHLALVWQPANRSLTLYRDKLAIISSMPVNQNVDLGHTSKFARIHKFTATSGVCIDEFRFWTEARTPDLIEYWADKIIPAPISSIITYAYLGSDAYGEPIQERFMLNEYPLQCYYRFDDGGERVEDFAHFQNVNYQLDEKENLSVVDDNTVIVIRGEDDVDGDGIPEWWINHWGLNAFPNAMDNNDGFSHPDVLANVSGSYTEPGNRFYTDWKDDWIWIDGKPVGIRASQSGVGYTPLGGRTNFYEQINSERKFWTVIPEGIANTEDGDYYADNQILGADMTYVTMHKYINLDYKPAKAIMSFSAYMANITGVLINQKLVSGVNTSDEGFDVSSYLRTGRNQIVVVWSRLSEGYEPAKGKYINPSDPYDDKGNLKYVDVDYKRLIYTGAIDCGLVVDGKEVIARGHRHPYDPRSVWYYRAMAAEHNVIDFAMDSEDGNTNYLNTHITSTSLAPSAKNYAIELDTDGDEIEVTGEYLLTTNPLEKDSDNNGISDAVEDHDKDGLDNYSELSVLNTDPLTVDTDNDGVKDGIENAGGTLGTDPNDHMGSTALALDLPADGYLEMPLQSRFALESFTIEVLVKTSAGATGSLLRRVVGTVDEAKPLINYELRLENGKPCFRFTDKDGDYSKSNIEAHNTIKDNTWTHIAGTYDKATNRMILYVDGKSAGYCIAANQPLTTGPARIFTRAGEDYTGLLDELRFWNYARSASDINANRGLLMSGDEDGLVAYYRFDDVTNYRNDDKDNNPFYKYTADSYIGSARDWTTGWSNAARIVNENFEPDDSGSVAAKIFVYSKNSSDATEAVVETGENTTDKNGNNSDILRAEISEDTGIGVSFTYSYFWFNLTKLGRTEPFKISNLALNTDGYFVDEQAQKIDETAVIGNDSELKLSSLTGEDATAGNVLQLVLVAASSNGNQIAVSQTVTLVEYDEDVDPSMPKPTVLRPPVLVSPLSDQTKLPAGQPLLVQVKVPSDIEGYIHIDWYRNMVLAKSSSTAIKANTEYTSGATPELVTYDLKMTDTAKVVDGEVWSFKVYIERTKQWYDDTTAGQRKSIDAAGRSTVIPAAAEAVYPEAEWIYMMIGETYEEAEESGTSTSSTRPTAPTKVRITPDSVNVDVESIIVAHPSGSTCKVPFNYCYQWYYKSNTSDDLVKADGQTMPYWQPVITGIDGDTGITDAGFTSYVLNEGDRLVCQVWAENIYGEFSKSAKSDTVVLWDATASGSSYLTYYETNDEWQEARPIYSKKNWLSTSDAAIQTHTFKHTHDQDWVYFIVPATATNAKWKVSFETNVGAMFGPGVTLGGAMPNTALDLYKLGSNGKLNDKPVHTARRYTVDSSHGYYTEFARFQDLELAPGIYYIQVWPEAGETADTTTPYKMHLYLEQIFLTDEKPAWYLSNLSGDQRAVEITPAAPGLSDDLEVTLNGFAYDGDGQPLSEDNYYYLWYRNGKIVPLNGVIDVNDYTTETYIYSNAVKGKKGKTIPASYTREGDVWYCVVYPYTEKFGYGDPMTTNSVTVGVSNWSMNFTTRKTFQSGTLEIEPGDETVSIGWNEFATFGFDSAVDEALPGWSTPSGEGAWQRDPLVGGATYSMGLTNNNPYLTKDFRPYGKTSSWFIVCEMGDPQDAIESFSLLWECVDMPDTSTSDVIITRMKKRSEGYYETVVGSDVVVSSNSSGEIKLTAAELGALQVDANGQRYAVFRVTLGTPDAVRTLKLVKGWNLVALSMNPINTAVDDIFSLNGTKIYSGSVYEYQGGRYVPAHDVVATRGYWLYSRYEGTINVQGTIETDSISLSEGWNIVGPVHPIADFAALYSAYIGAIETGVDGSLEIYEFDTATGGYKSAIVDGKYRLEVGKGYWIKAKTAVDLPVINTDDIEK